MKKTFRIFGVLATIFAIALTSCNDEPGDDSSDGSLVSSKVPDEGWSGDSENGVLKFSPDEYDEDDINTYFAFDMKSGICEKAVLNLVMSDVSEANYLAKMLKDGTWVNLVDDDDDDDDDDYDYATRQAKHDTRALAVTKGVLKQLSRAVSSSDFLAPIPVKQDGKTIYITIPNLQGMSADDLVKAVDLWSGRSWEAPDRVIFGTYRDGVYTCRNMHGLNIDYLIETKYNASGFCTKYTTTVTLPTTGWAKLYYELYEQQINDLEIQFGQRPTLKLDGKMIILDAVIVGDIPESQIYSMICALDWLNNCPILFNLF